MRARSLSLTFSLSLSLSLTLSLSLSLTLARSPPLGLALSLSLSLLHTSFPTRLAHTDVPLHLAAYEGKVDEVNTLIADGADVQAATETGWTALMWAARGDRPEV